MILQFQILDFNLVVVVAVVVVVVVVVVVGGGGGGGGVVVFSGYPTSHMVNYKMPSTLNMVRLQSKMEQKSGH